MRDRMVRWSRDVDGWGGAMVVYWTRQWDPIGRVDFTVLGEGQVFSWRRWWRLQKGILIDALVGWLEGRR